MDARAVAFDSLLVGAGAVAGALLRFATSALVPSRLLPLPGFPWATLAVNLAGALAIGALMLPSGLGHPARLLVVVGFLGSLTTLSAYSFETVDLWRSGHVGLAFANLLANGLGGPLLALAGWKARVAISG